MSDRTTLTLNYAACDREIVEKVFGPAAMETEEDGIVNAEYEEVDAGGCEELEELEKAGVPCWGRHEEGDEYQPGHVACVRKRSRSMMAGLEGNSVCVDVHLDTDNLYGVRQARSFAKHWRAAKAAVAKRANKTKKEKMA